MSYILDALRKAEAERHLGSVPDLHAQPAPVFTNDTPSHRSRNLIAAGMGLLALGGMALAWFLLSAPAPTQPQPQSTAQPGTLPAEASGPMPAEIVALGPVKPPAEPPPAALPARPKEKAPAAPKPKAAAPKPAPAPRATASREASREASRDEDLKLSTALGQSHAPPPRELPIHVQRELPAVSIGGYLYSENPKERQLLVNKRLLHEGAEVSPGLVLEKMLPNAAVFNYRGHRYQVAY